MVRGSVRVPKVSKRAYIPGKTGVSDARKSVEEYVPPDFGLARCWKSTLKGSILGFSGLENALLMSLSVDFVAFLQKSSDIVPDRTNGITFRHISDP